MENRNETPSKSLKEKLVTATLATGLILGGCQAPEEKVYSDQTKDCEPTEEIFDFAEGYDKEGVLVEIQNEKPKVIDGPAIIKPNPDNNDIIVIYPGQAYILENHAVVWRYQAETEEKMISGLEAQTKFFDGNIERITGQEKESFRFAQGYNSEGTLLSNETIKGPAIIKVNSNNDNIVVVYPGQAYILKGSATVWKYDGDTQEKMEEGLEAQIQFFNGNIEKIQQEEK